MDIAVPSRFACLKIEDDDSPTLNTEIKKKQNTVPHKKHKSAAKEASKGSWTITRKKGNLNEKTKTSPKQNQKKKKSQKGESGKAWEEWQIKDKEYINGVFEQEMHNAILQSKLEFEQLKNNSEKESPPSKSKKNKQKTMSWTQFIGSEDKSTKVGTSSKNYSKDFFSDVLQTAKEDVKREFVEENRKQRQTNFNEISSLLQLQEKLDAERQKNMLLEKQLKEAKLEIADVKKRNTILCSMLSQGEMKNKAEVLSEIERMNRLKAEMMDNITQLKGDLEKERTKSAEMKKQSKNVPKQQKPQQQQQQQAKKMPKKKSK